MSYSPFSHGYSIPGLAVTQLSVLEPHNRSCEEGPTDLPPRQALALFCALACLNALSSHQLAWDWHPPPLAWFQKKTAS